MCGKSIYRCLLGCPDSPSVASVHLLLHFDLIGIFMLQCIEWNPCHLSGPLFIHVSGSVWPHFSSKGVCEWGVGS